MFDGLKRLGLPGYSLLAVFGNAGSAPSSDEMLKWRQEDPSVDKLLSIKEVYDIGVGHVIVYDGIVSGVSYEVFDRARRCFNSTTPQRKFDGIEVKRDPAVTRQALTYLRQEAGCMKAFYDSYKMPDPTIDEFIRVLDARLAESAIGGSDLRTPGIK